MRAYLLSSLPVLALALTACGQPEATDTAEPTAAPAPAAAPETTAAEVQPEAAPTETAAAEPPAAGPSEEVLAAVALRQAPMKLLSWNFGPLGGMLRGAPFDAAVVQTNSTRMAQIGPMIPGVFVTDTRGQDVETRALDAIWADKADFDMKAAAMTDAAAAVAAAAATGDQAATTMALQALGGTCGGCHDNYRSD